MEAFVRRRIAYIAGRIASNKLDGGIYDYQESRYFLVSGNIDNSHISIYDYASASSISGTGANGSYQLYDHGESGSISLYINNGTISGYDYMTGSPFNGQVSPNGEVSLYDYGRAEYFSYQL